METIHILNNEEVTIIRKALTSYLNELKINNNLDTNMHKEIYKWLENEIKEAKKVYNKFSYVEIPYKTQEKLIKIAKSESKRLKKAQKSTKKD